MIPDSILIYNYIHIYKISMDECINPSSLYDMEKIKYCFDNGYKLASISDIVPENNVICTIEY